MAETPPIAFLLADTAISGTARLVMAHADALIERGHDVRIVTAGAAMTWRRSRAEWIYVDALKEYAARAEEMVVAIGAEDVAVARAIAGARAVPLDSLPMIVDEEFFHARVMPEHEPLRVLLAGSWHVEHHGMDDGYGAVAHARWFHQKLELIRVSPWAPSREEPLDSVQEFHVALTTDEMARLVRSCDVFLAPHHGDEQPCVTAAEALASGLACLLTATPVHRAFDESSDFALFAPVRNAVELGERLIELAGDEELRERLRARGREVAQQWRSQGAAARFTQQIDAGREGAPFPAP